MGNKFDEDFGFNEETEQAWVGYLDHFFKWIYPIFERHDISKDAALTTWFINRLRNAIPDDDVGNDITESGEEWKV